MALPDAHGAWICHHKTFGGGGQDVPLDGLGAEVPCPAAGPADIAVQRTRVEEAWAACPEEARPMIELQARGYSREEIAEKYRRSGRPLTAGEVHRNLAKARTRIRRNLGGAQP